MSFKMIIDRAEVDRLMAQSPKIVNAEMNKAFVGTANEFYRVFTKERLSGKAGIRVRRKVAGGTKKRGGVRVPARARAMGFGGFLVKRGQLAGKVAIMKNTSKIAIAHELGAVIRPKKGKHLFIKVSNFAAARRGGVQIKRGRKPKVIRVKSVKLKPRLQFIATWNRFVPRAVARLGKGLQEAARRIERNAVRRSSRAIAKITKGRVA